MNQMFREGTVRNEHEQRKRLEGLWWAGVLIWAGLIFAADSLGILPQVGEASAWSWVFFGAGLYGMLGNLYRATSLDRPNPAAWDYIWSAFLLLLGLGDVTAVDVFWPVALITVGLVIVVNTLRQRA
jgi:hypothetical protein